MSSLAAVGLGAFAAGLLLTPPCMALARSTGLVDRPGHLKPQTTAVPLLGGLSVFVAASIGAAPHDARLIAPLAGALALGIADDRLDLSPFIRLVAQVALGAAVAALSPTRIPNPWGYLLVVLATVILVNGVNLLDGLDALAASVVAIAAGGFALIIGEPGRSLALATAAGLVGFLFYNRPSARVYLGDGGAYLLGTCLALLLARAWATHLPWRTSVSSLLIVVLASAEVVFALTRRVRESRSVMRGDRRHPYDLLVARGWPVWAVDLSYAGVQAVLCAVAVATSHAGSLGVSIAVVVIGALLVIALAGATGSLNPSAPASN